MSLKDRVSLPTARLLLYTPNESLNRPTAGWLRHPEVVNAKCLKWGYFFSAARSISPGPSLIGSAKNQIEGLRGRFLSTHSAVPNSFNIVRCAEPAEI